MTQKARLRFVSLFVPDLAEAAKTYEALLGVAPIEGPSPAPARHPFAAAGPVAFELGSVVLALYQTDGKTTHPGDVGFGIETDVDQAAAVIREHGGLVFLGPAPLGDGRKGAVGVTSDRHFFEMVETATSLADRPSNG